MRVQHQTPQVITADCFVTPSQTDCLALNSRSPGVFAESSEGSPLSRGKGFSLHTSIGLAKEKLGIKGKIPDCTVQIFKTLLYF